MSDRAARVLKRFDVGATRVSQVSIVLRDGTEVPRVWHHIHVCERKDTVVPLKKDVFQSINKTVGLVAGWPDIEPGAMAVEAASKQGVDLWRDPMCNFGTFASV